MDECPEPRDAVSAILEQDRLEELERVRVTEPVATPAGTLATGSTGTVVAVWGGGAAYDVEFTEPFAALLALRRSQLRPVAAI